MSTKTESVRVPVGNNNTIDWFSSVIYLVSCFFFTPFFDYFVDYLFPKHHVLKISYNLTLEAIHIKTLKYISFFPPFYSVLIKVILASGYYAAFRVTLVAKALEGSYDGAIHITTDYEVCIPPDFFLFFLKLKTTYMWVIVI